MSEDDGAESEDWFEKALREDDMKSENGDANSDFEEFEQESDADDAFAGSMGSTDASGDADEETGGGPFEETGDDPPDDDTFDDSPSGDVAFDDDPSGDGGRDDSGGKTATDSFDDTDEPGAESPFDDTDEGTAGDPFDDTTDDPFGGGSPDGPFDGDGGAGEGLFDDDFASAFESTGDSEFDEAEFDSDIPRLRLGIEGLDEMIQGGIPERHLMVAIGAPGTGKTTFGLQFLHHGLRNGEHGVFITLEQSRETIIDTANERGWEFDHYEAENELAVVDMDPIEMANSLDNIRGELPELIEGFDADRLVLDSVSLLEMMYDDQARRRTEVFDFTRSLKDAGVTTFLTSEASESNPYASRHGIIEYLTDAVFVLQYVRSEGSETRLAVEIQKIRNANHSREKKPYEITMDGISVYQQANIF